MLLFIVVAILSFPIYYEMFCRPDDVFLVILNFLIGVYLLVEGSNYFVDGAASIANHLKVSEHTIGLTVVALATSLPEMAVSDIASFYRHPETSWGNAVGSNIANIGIVLGIAAIIMPLALSRYIKRDTITLGLVTGLLLFFVFIFRNITWWMGIIFVVIYLIYLNDIHGRKEEVEEIIPKNSMASSIILTICGALGIVWGANILVDSAVNISHVLGISEIIIAVTAIAIGTSLPELATTVSATIKKKHGIAVGNIIGSNIFNTLIVLGSAALIHPLNLKPESLLLTSLFLGITTFSVILLSLYGKIGKIEGIALLAIYGVFLYLLVI